jgi:hypothetical protein
MEDASVKFPVPVAMISAILGAYGPLQNVTANWPRLEGALDDLFRSLRDCGDRDGCD